MKLDRRFIDVVKLVEEYVGEENWLVRENANVNKTFTGLFHYVAQQTMRRYSEFVYRDEAVYHRDGWVHLHDFPFAAFTPYCAGWSLQKLFRKGLITQTVRARPAKHLDSAVDHVANFLMAAQHEWAGAQAFSGVDLYLGAFVRADGLVGDRRRVKQQIQRLVYNLNFPSRIAAQTPFTNFTILLDTVKSVLEDSAYVGGVEAGKLGDYLDEAMLVTDALIEVLEEGDAVGQPFTFPIPTIMVTERFDWNERRWGDLTYKIFRLTAKRGSFYFLNACSGVIDPDAAFAMCLFETERIPYKADGVVKVATMEEFLEEVAGDVEAEEPDGAKWYRPRKTVEVLSVDVESGRVEWRPVKRILVKKYDKAIRIRLVDGRVMVVSPDHPIPVYTTYTKEVRVRRACELLGLKRVSHRVPVLSTSIKGQEYPRLKLDDGRELLVDEEFGYFMGLYYGDGTLVRSRYYAERCAPSKVREGYYLSGVQFSVNSEESKLREFLTEFSRRRLGREAKVRYDPRWPSVCYVIVYDAPLARALYDNGVSPFSDEKRIPWFIWTAPASVRRAFIRGLLDSDGYWRDNSWELHIKNRELAEDVLLLSSMTGVEAYLRENKDCSVTVYFPSNEGKEIGLLEAWKHHRQGDIAWVGIDRVEEVSVNGKFIDVEVDGEHYFVHSTGVVTHNCCRLTIDRSKFMMLNGAGLALSLEAGEVESVGRHLGGTWSIPDETGSIGVVTLNMPRIGFEARGDMDKLLGLLDYYMGVARKHLKAKRKRLEWILKSRIIDLPITRNYLGTYSFHYNTIGVLGLPEFAANFLGEPKLWIEMDRRMVREAIKVMRRALSYMHKRIKEFELEDHCLYNIEEVPGEGASYRLARIDYKRYHREVKRGEYCMPMFGGEPFYSNSVIPYYADVSLPERIRLESKVHPLFTGGVMMHIHMYEAADPEALKKLVYRIVKTTKVVYFSITPSISVCTRCGWHAAGIYRECPKCGSEQVDWWSRIVGYYRPLRNWNPGKRAEFFSRVSYGSLGPRRISELAGEGEV